MSDATAKDRGFLALNAKVLANQDVTEKIKLDVQYNKIEFIFPAGLNTIPLVEECRALNNLEEFDFMYDITMQMLVSKPVHIVMKDYDDKKYLMAKFVVTDRFMDLRGVSFLNSYPIVVSWLAEFVAGMLSKKYPRPLKEELEPLKLDEETKNQKGDPRKIVLKSFVTN